MESEVLFDALNDNIFCNHKIVTYKGTFYHYHDAYELFLLLNGNVNYYIESLEMQIERGSLILINPYVFHCRGSYKGNFYERIVINIKEPYIKTTSSEKTNMADCFFSHPSSKSSLLKLNEQQITEFIIIAQRLSKEIESNEYGSDILVDSYMKQILVMVNRISKNQKIDCVTNLMPSLVSNVIAYIEENITEEISLDILSDCFHYNGTYLSRCFKNITGITLQQYIIQKRITLAKKYLFEGYSSKDACFLSGFNDYSNFSRTFKKQTGLSPKEFISQNT